MKQRRSSVREGRQKNVKAEKNNWVSKHANREKKPGSIYSEISSVILSDTDSSQSDGDTIDLTVVKDIKKPSRIRGGLSNRLIEESETPTLIKSQETSQKIFLAPSTIPEDTLGKFQLLNKTTEPETRSKCDVESDGEEIEECAPALNESSAEFSVESGPSSPNENTALCRECETLFNRMRRQKPSKEKDRDKNPTSLSCDQWVLLKKWHPQRGRHRKKGLLWSSLMQIRKMAVQGLVFDYRSQSICSRPHVFQQRSLRHCKYLASLQTDQSMTKSKLQHRRRQRPVAWPPIGGRKPVKRKSSMNKTLSQPLLSPELNITKSQKAEKVSVLNLSTRASKQKSNNVQDRFDKQETCDGVEGTRRVLKFDDTPEVVAVETAEQSQGPRRRLERGEIRVGTRNGVETKDSNGPQEEFFEDWDGFKTPTDLCSVKPKIKSASQEIVQASGDTRHTLQTANFRSMLATMVKNQNKIIKESFQ